MPSMFPLTGAAEDLWFATGQYTTTVTSLLSCSRASTGYAQDSGGNWISFGNDTLRITDRGLLVEDARTNNLLNSDAPATQTTASLTTGDYTLWVEGSGSALASAGSATITGAASASAGNPDTFTVTGAGTVTVTVTGSLTKFQLELGTFPSSFILTAGAAATRATDIVTFSGSPATIIAADAAQTVVVDGISITSTVGREGIISDNGGTGIERLSTASDSTVRNGAIAPVALGNSLLFSIGVKVGYSMDTGSGYSIVGGGGTVATDPAHSSVVGPSLGRDAIGAGDWYGYFRRVTVWNSKVADATLQSLTDPNSAYYADPTTLMAQACL